MKVWTYKEARDKLLGDSDQQDQSFISPNELIGYFNEGIEEAEAEILKIDEDYLLTSFPVPLVNGVAAYDYPYNIYAYKLRGLIYANGTIIYDVRRFRRNNKFENLAFATQYNTSDDYVWFHSNDSSAIGAKINLIPPARETAVVPPLASPFTPMTGWYIRQANRVPLIGEYVPKYETLVQTTAINIATDVLTVAQAYVTGDTVKLTSNGTMPGGLTAGTVYYAIAAGTSLKLATTLQLAQAGTAIDITSTGAGLLYISIAANQSIVDNTLIDIPEFTKFVIQWAKCRCFEKEGDPRLSGATETLTQQREQMVSTLTEAQPDDQNTIEADMSAYNEMS